MKYFNILWFVLILSSCSGSDGVTDQPVNSAAEAEGPIEPIELSEVAAGVTVDDLRTELNTLQQRADDGEAPEDLVDPVLALNELIQAKAEEVVGTPEEDEVTVLADEVAVLVDEVMIALVPRTYDQDHWVSGDNIITFYTNTIEVAAMDQTPVNVGERTWVHEMGIVGRACKEWYAIAEFATNETSITDGTLTDVLSSTDGITCKGQGGPDQPFNEFNGANIELTPSDMLGVLIKFEIKRKLLPAGTIVTIDEFMNESIIYSHHYPDGRIRTFSFQ